MAWKLTDGLANLRDQVNVAFPNRDEASDGTIGDAAHQAETSGHNPDDTAGSKPEWNGDPDSTPEVRAWDMDSDLRAAPATAQQVVDHIRTLPGVSSMLRYMIYNRRIYKASNGWAAETYDGPSAHTEHIHFSGAYSQAADNDTSFDYRLGEIPGAQGGDMLPIPKGANSEDVRLIQMMLNDLADAPAFKGEWAKLTADGNYGDATQVAVNAYRKHYGQGPNDGITAWQYFCMMRDMAGVRAGQDGAAGKQGPAGPQGPQGPAGPVGPKGDPGTGGSFSGTLTVLGGQLEVTA